MIRTRDLVLFVVVVLFLLSGIAFTVATDRDPDRNTLSANIALITSEPPTVASDAGGIDRASNIADLRAKLAKGEGVISQGSPVFESVDTKKAEEMSVEENPDAQNPETSGSVHRCSVETSFERAIAKWPRGENVDIELVEGARLVSTMREEMVTVGSSTIATTTRDVLMQLPVRPFRGMGQSCVDNEVVGVALDGTLIRNDETWRFRSVSSESIIGYARDGFPIYGPGVDETQLDSCGGYDNGVGYRYHLRENELFVLGCFAAEPQSFIE